EEGGAESRSSAANGGFFGGNEPHCARCSNADAGGQAQVITCSECGQGFHTFCVGEKRIPYALFPPEQRVLRDAFVAEHIGARWQCSKCQTQASQATMSPFQAAGNDLYTP
ncbi:unnamed protein product, partial [Ectocarpus sp. 12 AP-2014]